MPFADCDWWELWLIISEAGSPSGFILFVLFQLTYYNTSNIQGTSNNIPVTAPKLVLQRFSAGLNSGFNAGRMCANFESGLKFVKYSLNTDRYGIHMGSWDGTIRVMYHYRERRSLNIVPSFLPKLYLNESQDNFHSCFRNHQLSSMAIRSIIESTRALDHIGCHLSASLSRLIRLRAADSI